MPTSAESKGLPSEKKREIGERLMRGEDVDITLTSEPQVMTDEGGPAQTRITDLGEVASNGDTGGVAANGHGHSHVPQPAPDDTVPADLVIQVLSNRAGMRETDLAVREARILMLEAEIRELHEIIEQIQGN